MKTFEDDFKPLALEEQLCTIEQGIKLKALGVPQKSLFCIYVRKPCISLLPGDFDPKPCLDTPQNAFQNGMFELPHVQKYEKVSLFTVSELHYIILQVNCAKGSETQHIVIDMAQKLIDVIKWTDSFWRNERRQLGAFGFDS